MASSCTKLMKEALKASENQLFGSLAFATVGGLATGIEETDSGLSISPIKFLEGAAAGLGIKFGINRYSNKSNIAMDLSHIYSKLTKDQKGQLIKMSIEPKYIITDAFTPNLSDTARFDLAMKKLPLASKDGLYEQEELWDKGKYFVDWDGFLRKWIDIKYSDVKPLTERKSKVLNKLPKYLQEAIPDLKTTGRVNKLREEIYGSYASYFPIKDKIESSSTSIPHLLHETQHAIQSLVGMESGTNPGRFKNNILSFYGGNSNTAYFSNLGEIYARMAESETIDSSPLLKALNKYRDKINIEGTNGPTLLTGIASNSKAPIGLKLLDGQLTMEDLPEIRKVIEGVQETNDMFFLSNEKLLKEYGISTSINKVEDKISILNSIKTIKDLEANMDLIKEGNELYRQQYISKYGQEPYMRDPIKVFKDNKLEAVSDAIFGLSSSVNPNLLGKYSVYEILDNLHKLKDL